METSKQTSTRAVQVILVVVAFISVVGLFYGSKNTWVPDMFVLRWNFFALLSLMAVIVNLYLIYLSTKINIRGPEAVWFTLFLSSTTAFGICEFFTRMSATPSGALFWIRLLSFGPLVASAGTLFVLNYLNTNSKYVRLTSMLILGSIMMFFFASVGNAVFENNLEHIKLFSYGYYTPIGKYFIFYALWTYTVPSAGIYLMIRYFRRTNNPILAKQAKLFAWALALPLIGATITDGVLPSFGIYIFSWYLIFATASAGLMLWGLKRYQVFKVSPALLSEEILALMSEAVVVVNPELQILFVNQETEQLFKRADGALANRSLLDFVSGESTQNLTDKLGALQAEKTLALDDVIITNDEGGKTYARVSISRVTEASGIEGFIMVLTDITELKNSYEALEKEKAGVEHTVQVRTRELRAAQEKLMETDKMKTEFVVLTSHNLRTPLTTILGDVELLGSPTIEDAKKVSLLKGLQESSKKLGDLVEDLLTISNIEAGDMVTMEAMSAETLLAPLLEDADRFAEATHNTLKTNITVGSSQIKANTIRLRTALRNVVDNACKFTKEGHIDITAVADDKKIAITVADTGIGIPEDEIPKLFTEFHRGTSAMQYDYEGEGIGLYLTKLIIEEHGGTIHISSKPGEGTTVTVSLPIVPAAA